MRLDRREFGTLLGGVLVSSLSPCLPAFGARQDAVPKPAPLEIPFEYAPPLRPHVVVRAQLNQGEPMRFVLDTGAETGLIVFDWAAKKLKLASAGVTGTVNNGEAATTLVEAGRLIIPTNDPKRPLTIGAPKAWQIAPPTATQSYVNPPLAGIIGAELLWKVASRIDFDTKIWTVYGLEAVPLPSSGRKTWKVPVTKRQNTGGIALPFVTLTANDASGKPLALLNLNLDTGSVGTVLPSSLAKALASAPRAQGQGAFAGVAGLRPTEQLLLPSAMLGDALTRHLEVTLVPGLAVGNLGLNFLERFRLTLNPVGESLYLEERPGFVPPLGGDAGIAVSVENSVCTVRALAPTVEQRPEGGEPLRVGDRLISVDGSSLAGLPLWAIQSALSGREGQPARLQVQTGSKPPRIVTVGRRSRWGTAEKAAREKE